MPGLQSFCVCTAIALGCIYVLQVSWFVAWLVVDEKRILSNRNGLLPCIIHHKPRGKSLCSKYDLSSSFKKFYSKLLSFKMYQVNITNCSNTDRTSIEYQFPDGHHLLHTDFCRLWNWRNLHDQTEVRAGAAASS